MKRYLLTLSTLLMLIFAGQALAASGGGLLSQRAYDDLNDIHEMMDKKQYTEALTKANAMLKGGSANSEYEKAVTLQTIAYIYIYQDNYDQAARYLQQALNMDVFAEHEEEAATIALAQVYVSQDQYQKAIDVLEKYLKSGKELPPTAYILAATSYFSLEKAREALPYAKKAVQLSDAPRKDWYNLLLGIYYELNDYREAAKLLETMVAFWPDDKEFWRYLASIYLELEEDDKALATLALAYRQGMLEEESHLLNLSRLYLMDEVPYKAAEVLAKSLADKKVEATADNLELLSMAWTQAREYERAVEVLGEAGAKAEDGELYLRQARLYAALQNWNGVVSAVDKALKKGKLEKPGAAYILQGMAAVEEEEYDQALKAFQKARGFEESEDQASQWITYVQTDLMRVAATRR